MPIYEYACEKCGENTEIIKKITDPPSTQCPKCQSHSLRKKTSVSAFHLKGSGWYKDGYNGANPNQSQSSEAKPEGTESKTTENKTETKKSGESSSDTVSTSTSNASEPTRAEPTSSAAG